MSTKSHFIYEDGVEGFEETSEPQSIFGKWTGYNAYLIIDNSILKESRLKGEYLIIETKNTEYLPNKFQLWGDAIIEAEWDEEGLMVILKGGHHITKKIINNDYPNAK